MDCSEISQMPKEVSLLSELRVQDLCKQMKDYRIEADFSIQVGQRVALMGPSGSGKTTLLRLLAGLDPLQEGRDFGKLFLGQKEITFLSPQEREVGFVFQDQALFSGMNVLDNVTFGLRMRGIHREQREKMGLEWLGRVGLAQRASSWTDHLSGGEKQRVAFVRALIWKPKLVLLDEPFSALDLKLRVALRHELLELHRLWPAPLLLVTHDWVDVQAVATSFLSLEAVSGSSIWKVRRELTNPGVFE